MLGLVFRLVIQQGLQGGLVDDLQGQIATTHEELVYPLRVIVARYFDQHAVGADVLADTGLGNPELVDAPLELLDGLVQGLAVLGIADRLAQALFHAGAVGLDDHRHTARKVKTKLDDAGFLRFDVQDILAVLVLHHIDQVFGGRKSRKGILDRPLGRHGPLAILEQLDGLGLHEFIFSGNRRLRTGDYQGLEFLNGQLSLFHRVFADGLTRTGRDFFHILGNNKVPIDGRPNKGRTDRHQYQYDYQSRSFSHD